jgi:hypothetical protein
LASLVAHAPLVDVFFIIKEHPELDEKAGNPAINKPPLEEQLKLLSTITVPVNALRGLIVAELLIETAPVPVLNVTSVVYISALVADGEVEPRLRIKRVGLVSAVVHTEIPNELFTADAPRFIPNVFAMPVL